MLSELQNKIESHNAQIGVIGLGYVGLPVACMMAESGFQTIGIDIDRNRINMINAGKNPILGIEPGLAGLISRVVESGRLHCSTDYSELAICDVILISVQTPIEETDHRPRYEHMKTALTSLGKVLKNGALVIVESTLAPGTIQNVIVPTLEDATNWQVNEGFFVGHCPERVTPGRLIRNLTEMSRVVGGSTPQVAVIMKQLYANYVRGELDETDMLTAEIVKTAENAYRDVQIAFANELATICQSLGGDVWQVRELVNKSPGRNVLLPGAGVGGHCIPKDPWLLIANASQATPQLIPAARQVNRAMPQHIANMLTKSLEKAGNDLADSIIAVLGYAYMENSDDTRDTPSQTFISLIEDKVAEIRIHDPFVEDYQHELSEIIQGADAVVLLVKHDMYNTEDWNKHSQTMRTRIFIDSRHILPDNFSLKEGWVSILGQGEGR